MTTTTTPFRVGQTLLGPLFNEPMRVETVAPAGMSSWALGLVGAQSERFRRVTLTEADLDSITILDAEMAFNGDGTLLRLGMQAYSLGIAYEFDPWFGLSLSRVHPLPHQLEAVYDHMLKLARVRFLLADDAGAGKTIMAGLLIKELQLRGLCERIRKVLQRLLEKLQEIRNALDDDAVFNVVGEVLPAAQIERVLRDYYAGRLGDADLEDRLLHNVDEGRFRAICQNALEGLASKRLNLEMLIERRAKAQERRVIPETIARFLAEAAGFSSLTLQPVPSLPHTYDPGRTPTVLMNYERGPDWRLPSLSPKYPRLSTDRDTADANHLEWVMPGHPLFEAVRRHTWSSAQEHFKKGACFYSLAHEAPARIDFYRARVVDGLGQVVHERLFGIEVGDGREPCPREPAVYVVTHCNTTPRLREPIRDPARLEWTEVTKVAHDRIDTRGLPGGGA